MYKGAMTNKWHRTGDKPLCELMNAAQSSDAYMRPYAPISSHTEAETKWLPISWRQFQMHFLLEKIYILNKISRKFVTRGLIKTIFQHWFKPLSEPMLTYSNDAYMHRLASTS